MDDRRKDDPGAVSSGREGEAKSWRTPRTSSRALLGAARELIIEHEGREYRLRLTNQGKLILN